jgi:hypothetical protein
MAFFERMAATVRATGHIVKIEHSLDFKRHMASAFDEGQVAARIGNLGQVNQLAVVQVHGVISWMEVAGFSELRVTRAGGFGVGLAFSAWDEKFVEWYDSS